jgi:hypothetical protein
VMAGFQGVVTGVILGKSTVAFLARILGLNGQPITVASIVSITWNVQDLATQTQVATGSWIPGAVVFDSLRQNDPRWTQDSVDNIGSDGLYGYNFLAELDQFKFVAQDVDPITGLPQTHRYQVDVEFTPVVGTVFRQTWQLVSIPTWS